jgi:hypothetical protein
MDGELLFGSGISGFPKALPEKLVGIEIDLPVVRV